MLNVINGGALKGSGSLNDVALQTNDVVAPGNSIGTWTMSSLSVSPGAVYEAELSPDERSDFVHVTDSAILNCGEVQLITANYPGVTSPAHTLHDSHGGYNRCWPV